MHLSKTCAQLQITKTLVYQLCICPDVQITDGFLPVPFIQIHDDRISAIVVFHPFGGKLVTPTVRDETVTQGD